MMTRLQVAAAVIVGYWLGRGHRKKLGMLLAAAGAGRLAGGPQEMVDRATGLLQSSPEFAELSESVRGQLLDAVKVAAMTAVTARVDALNNRLLAGSDEVLATAESLVEDTAHMVGDVGDDTAGTVGKAAGGTVATVGKLAGGTLGAVGALGRRKRPKKAPPPDDRDEGSDDKTAAQTEERPARRQPPVGVTNRPASGAAPRRKRPGVVRSEERSDDHTASGGSPSASSLADVIDSERCDRRQTRPGRRPTVGPRRGRHHPRTHIGECKWHHRLSRR